MGATFSELTVINQVVGTPFFDFLEDMAASGVKVRLLTGKALPERFSAMEGLEIAVGPAYERATFATRGKTWLRFTAWVARQLAVRRPRGPVFIVSNPPTAPWLALPLRVLAGAPVVILIYDVYPDAAVELGMVGAGHPLARLWRAANLLSFRASGGVITLGERMAERVAAQTGGREDVVSIIENWADPSFLAPIPKADNDFAREHGLVETTNVVYSGNLGATRGLELFLEAARRLAHRPEIRFVIIGEGSERPRIERALAEGEAGNVLLLPFQPAEVFPRSQAAVDIAIVPQDPRSDGVSVPSKLYSAMACGCAILAVGSGTNELAATVRGERCGLSVGPEDADGFASAIERMHDEPGYRDELGANARAAVERRFNREACVRRYQRALEAACERAAKGRFSGLLRP